MRTIRARPNKLILTAAGLMFSFLFVSQALVIATEGDRITISAITLSTGQDIQEWRFVQFKVGQQTIPTELNCNTKANYAPIGSSSRFAVVGDNNDTLRAQFKKDDVGFSFCWEAVLKYENNKSLYYGHTVPGPVLNEAKTPNQITKNKF